MKPKLSEWMWLKWFSVCFLLLQDCTNPRYLAAGTSNAVKLSRFFDKVRKSALVIVMRNFPETQQMPPLC